MPRVQQAPNGRNAQQRFEDFHASRPEVYRYLVNLAFDLKRKGFRKYGIKGLFERVRWHFRGQEEFKLNNNYHSRYARLIMQDHPELSDFFELRELKAK